jgi:hypothetical protein
MPAAAPPLTENLGDFLAGLAFMTQQLSGGAHDEHLRGHLERLIEDLMRASQYASTAPSAAAAEPAYYFVDVWTEGVHDWVSSPSPTSMRVRSRPFDSLSARQLDIAVFGDGETDISTGEYPSGKQVVIETDTRARWTQQRLRLAFAPHLPDKQFTVDVPANRTISWGTPQPPAADAAAAPAAAPAAAAALVPTRAEPQIDAASLREFGMVKLRYPLDALPNASASAGAPPLKKRKPANTSGA